MKAYAEYCVKNHLATNGSKTTFTVFYISFQGHKRSLIEQSSGDDEDEDLGRLNAKRNAKELVDKLPYPFTQQLIAIHDWAAKDKTEITIKRG